MKLLHGLVGASLLGAGFAAGWLVKPAPPASALAKNSANPLSVSAAVSGNSAPPPSPQAVGPVLEKISSQWQELARLSTEEFARLMVDAWLNRGDEDSLMKKALFAASCDAPKAAAFYAEFKRRKGLASSQEGGQELREFMVMAGKRYGRDFVNELLAVNPSGVADIDSLIHGWVLERPQEAVDWLNSLPSDAAYYSTALHGLVWGLGEKSPEAAVEVFQNLDPELRTGKLYWSLGSAVIKVHGIDGLNNILSQFSDDKERQQMLNASLPMAMDQPPQEFVTKLAGQVEPGTELASAFSSMTRHWIEADANASIAWLQSNAEGKSVTAKETMARALVRNGHLDAVETWLASNPEGVARERIFPTKPADPFAPR